MRFQDEEDGRGLSALEAWQAALHAKRAVLGEEHLRVADCLFAVGQSLYFFNIAGQSLAPLRSALRIRKAALGVII